MCVCVARHDLQAHSSKIRLEWAVLWDYGFGETQLGCAEAPSHLLQGPM